MRLTNSDDLCSWFSDSTVHCANICCWHCGTMLFAFCQYVAWFGALSAVLYR